MSQKDHQPVSLALETSSLHSSVAIGRGNDCLAARAFDKPRAHAAKLIAMIDIICREQGVNPPEIQRILVSVGPGSFTGLRIGIAAARTLVWAGGAELVPVDSLAGIAWQAGEVDDPPEFVAVILDAKRDHVYSALYRRTGGALEIETDVAETSPGEFLASCPDGTAVMGDGVVRYRDLVDQSGLRILPESTFGPRAESVFMLGQALADAGKVVGVRELVPRYVRPPEAEERWAERQKAAKG